MTASNAYMFVQYVVCMSVWQFDKFQQEHYYVFFLCISLQSNDLNHLRVTEEGMKDYHFVKLPAHATYFIWGKTPICG